MEPQSETASGEHSPKNKLQDEEESPLPEVQEVQEAGPQANGIKVADKTPEPDNVASGRTSKTPDSPDLPAVFDWDDFEKRYEDALEQADAREKEILKEAEELSRYFQAWASAASSHDDERAVKRLQTRRRYVNLSETAMERKQDHYEQVVKAFESALALLRN